MHEKGQGAIGQGMKPGTGLRKALRKGGKLQPNGKIVFAHNALGQPVCGAHPNSPKGPCQSPFITENGRCKMHGGTSPRGVDHPSFKHGGYSDALKGDLAANFRAMRDDKNLISMRDNIALFGARIQQLLEQLDENNDVDKFNDILLFTREVRSAWAAGESDKIEQCLDKIEAACADGINNDALWKQVTVLAEAQRRQAETEQKLVGLTYKMLTGEDVYFILTVLAREINVTVQDPKAKSHLSKVLKGLVSRDEPSTDDIVIQKSLANS